jgi:hypothetical protein
MNTSMPNDTLDEFLDETSPFATMTGGGGTTGVTRTIDGRGFVFGSTGEATITNPYAPRKKNPDEILRDRVRTAIRSGSRIPKAMGEKYCELVRKERHLSQEERRYFNKPKADSRKMCDVVVEDIES